MQFSQFGQKFAQDSGILQLMHDLGTAMQDPSNYFMLGGGNPAHVPAVQTVLRERMQSILHNHDEFERMIGNYDTPQGSADLNHALAELLQETYGWPLTAANIALTNGSQSAFFMLFNLLAGQFADGNKQVLLPLAPEYIGYGDLGISDDLFTASKPEIELIGEHFFKYHVDFEHLKVDETTAAICVSRPTNPTGNVLTDQEIERLSALAKQHNIPLIIDGAYGTPFPDIIFADAKPVWDQHIILCLSLSKFGIPAARTGIVIASEEVIAAVSAMSAVLTLAPNSVGPTLALNMVQDRSILSMSRELILLFYQQKMQQAVGWIEQYLQGLPYRLHQPEGAFFLWLWCEDLPISSQELYERLKQRQVLVVSGHYFFFGLNEPDWDHQNQCLRISYAQPEETVEGGIRRIGETLREVYGFKP